MSSPPWRLTLRQFVELVRSNYGITIRTFGYPMIGSHDPRLISIAQELARRAGRKLDEYEFQMLYGIRSDEHLRLAAEGHRMRVYTAYGTDWYGYFMRRLAEKPANLRFFVRSMVSKG